MCLPSFSTDDVYVVTKKEEADSLIVTMKSWLILVGVRTKQPTLLHSVAGSPPSS